MLPTTFKPGSDISNGAYSAYSAYTHSTSIHSVFAFQAEAFEPQHRVIFDFVVSGTARNSYDPQFIACCLKLGVY